MIMGDFNSQRGRECGFQHVAGKYTIHAHLEIINTNYKNKDIHKIT